MRQLLALSLLVCVSLADVPYMATGVKVGEVTETSAIIWTRLTEGEHRVGPDAPTPIVNYRDPKTGAIANEGNSRVRVPIVEFPNGASVDQLEGAAPGCGGEVRVDWVMEVSGTIHSTEWVAVDPDRDYTHQFLIKDLKPGAGYMYRVWTRAKSGTPETMATFGAFRTACASNEPWPVTFTVTTGQEYNDKDSPNGYRMYEGMKKVSPNFFVHTGDILYYDALAKTLPLARWHWQRMYSLQTNVDFHKDIASYFIKDDHDTWMNDCWPTMQSPYMGDFTFAQGQAVFLEQVPMSEKTYRTFRWGKDLQIWLVEGRDFRSANDLPDGPEKTIWGKDQKEWFKKTVAESDASFRVLISPTPIV
ncbi:MAG: alkaline phosphatase D family protein, partial [Candidatus Hydrogenedentes bacterium]|nr:alkaline phosphatase D family protein [Candidatus Hydrogenedentota bacterium]